MVNRKRGLSCGVGVNDADYVIVKKESWYEGGKKVSKQIWKCPYYSKWYSMIERCYSKKFQEKSPTYKGCTVSEEWLTFSNFRRWMVDQEVLLGGLEGMQPDKDILFEGNKIYSEDTCVFVHVKVNNFMMSRNKARGKNLIGCHCVKDRYNFRAECQNPLTSKSDHLGYFDSEMDAHIAWKTAKHKYAGELSNSIYVTDSRVAERLLAMYAPNIDWTKV